MRHHVFWGSAISGLVAYDVYRARQNDESTLSCITRRTLRVHTRPGQIAFIGGWLGLSAWLVPHIIVPALKAIDDAIESLDDCQNLQLTPK